MNNLNNVDKNTVNPFLTSVMTTNVPIFIKKACPIVKLGVGKALIFSCDFCLSCEFSPSIIVYILCTRVYKVFLTVIFYDQGQAYDHVLYIYVVNIK